MNKYELTVIVDATNNQEQKEAILKEAVDSVVRFNGKVINSQVWIEKHKFSFRIKKKTEGTYYLINFEAKADAIKPLREILRLNEKILRSLIIKVE